jgi:lipopolysaccharide biosynthesis protein
MDVDRASRTIARVVALYLPQFHPIPENDHWWGAGFTEWTNVRKAVPLFQGHDQPRIPAELGYYDLRDPAVRDNQARLAAAHGVNAFCYYHYWFAGTELLQRPFAEVLASGEPDFPFCLCWANESWTGIWHGAPDRVLIEQTYPGRDDHVRHFHALLPAFTDPRYLRIHNQPVFLIYIPAAIPEVRSVLDLWRELALRAGLPGIYFVGMQGYRSQRDARSSGCDASMTARLPPHPSPGLLPRRIAAGDNRVFCYDHAEAVDLLIQPPDHDFRDFPCIGPGWDNTPRIGGGGIVLHGSRPDLFRRNVETALQRVHTWEHDERVIFVKSWNEWAEGNYLEPDTRFGRGYLEALRDARAARAHS